MWRHLLEDSEDAHAQVFGRINKPHDIQDKSTTALQTLDLSATHNYNYRLCLLKQERDHMQNVSAGAIVGNLI